MLAQPRETAIFWQPSDNNEHGPRNRINEYMRFDPERIHLFTKERGSARLFFVTRTAEWPTGIIHALRQTRAQRRLKIGTNLGKPVYSDERDESITDHAYDPVRYALASRAPVPTDKSNRVEGTFSRRRRLSKHFRQGLTIR